MDDASIDINESKIQGRLRNGGESLNCVASIDACDGDWGVLIALLNHEMTKNHDWNHQEHHPTKEIILIECNPVTFG